jgi:trk system potassium uptake protein
MYSWLQRFNSAELMVGSFALASVIGGSLLYGTEMQRTVHYKEEVVTTQIVDGKPVSTTEIVDKTKLGESYLDMLFTAVSALCVTGLITTDFSQFTLLGQIITMILIQIGGLGVITFTSFFAMLIVGGISERQSFREILSGMLDTGHDKVADMLGHVLKYTLFFEGLAFLVMGWWLAFIHPELQNGINPRWWALFHSVSAFNNAWFALFSDNLMKFVMDPVISVTIALLIIFGGIWYPVLISIHTWMRKRITHRNDVAQKALETDVQDVVSSPVQTKIAIYGTIILILVGMIVSFLVDGNNPVVMGYTAFEQMIIHFFQSVSTRTAGFNTIDYGALAPATLLIYIILMFIWANPAGTGWGIKIPTITVLFAYVKDWYAAPGQATTILGHKVSKFAVSHAVRLFLVAISACFLVTFLILMIENNHFIATGTQFNFLKVCFEVVSAFATVGLSMGFAGSVTSFSALLAPASKVCLILIMLLGRLWPLTVLAALPAKKIHENAPLTEDHDGVEKIQIG